MGDTAKNCAIGCATGMGLGWVASKFPKWGKKAWDAVRCKTGYNSFASDTLVHIKPVGAKPEDALMSKTATKPLGEIKVGDEVLALSEWKAIGDDKPLDGRLSYEKVTDIYSSHKAQTLVQLTLANGETLSATEGHPFKTMEGWRDAILLKKGGKLLLKGGDGDPDSEQTVEIVDVKTEQKVLPVFNLEVANAHTYFIGTGAELVHNGYGSYTCYFKSGKRYHGKGDLKRAKKSAEREAKRNNDPVDRIEHKPEKNDMDSFKAEHERIKNDGGVNNSDNYNRINSPGAKM